MAQERPVTPEKQLLKLIEESQSKKQASLKTQAAKQKKTSFFSFGAWKSRFSFSRGKFKTWLSGQGALQLDIRAINRILAVCMLGIIAYFITTFTISMQGLREMPDLGSGIARQVKLTSAPAVPVLKNEISYYLDRSNQRDIFKMGRRPVITKIEDQEELPLVDEGADIVNNLKLVGISWSDNPDAMVEDQKAYRTFFVRKGNMIGEMKVESIKKDSLILSYKGKEYELR